MRRLRPWPLVTVLAALAGVGFMTGCYERVVRAEGLGEESVDTYEANVPADKGGLEKAMWGDDSKKEETWRDR